MKTNLFLFFTVILLALNSCNKNKRYDKGFSDNPEIQSSSSNEMVGFHKDSIFLSTRPNSVLLTGFQNYRLLPIYKVNQNRRDDSYYVGSNHYYRNYKEIGYTNGNNWHFNFMPGLQAVYGFNLVNVSVIKHDSKTQFVLFEKPVLIKTIYYPSFSNDTLFNLPVKRDYYMISVYDEDTNNDGYINLSDLRRFYLFNIEGGDKKELIPNNYSVISSEYDLANDYMYVFAQFDNNQNGQIEDNEDLHVFWIDLKNPTTNGKIYK